MLPDALRARGAEVEVLALYETVAEPLAERALAAVLARRLRHLHLLLDGRASSSAPRAPSRALAPATRIVSIGPVTSATLREHGLPRTSRPQRHDIDGVIEAISPTGASGRP